MRAIHLRFAGAANRLNAQSTDDEDMLRATSGNICLWLGLTTLLFGKPICGVHARLHDHCTFII